MKIQTDNKNNLNFKAHLPRTFSGVMNYLYKTSKKITPDTFEHNDTIRISTRLKNGKEISGSVNFLQGKYIGLILDEGYERFRSEFIKTIIEKFKTSMAKGNTRNKLGYDD